MAFKAKYPNCRQFCQKEARSQVLRFGGGKIHLQEGKIFVFIICLKQIFLSTTKFGGHKKIWGYLPPNAPPCLRAWAEPSPESLPLGVFMFVQGG